MRSVGCAAILCCTTASPLHDNERTRLFNQTVDHFNSETKGVWRQRFYVNETFFKKPSGAGSDSPPPLFFIPGGEWSVGPTKGILYGMAHELAAQHGGLMAIAEHRFYGESLPLAPMNPSWLPPTELVS